MAVLKKILVGLVVVVALVLGAGLLLPRHVHVERSARVDAPPATVFALVNGYRNFNKWSPWFERDPDASYTYEGPEFGVGARMKWEGDPKKVGSGTQEIVESAPWSLVRTSLDFGGQGTGSATFRLEPDGAGTRVSWGFDSDLGMNPVSRYFGLLFDRMIGPDYEQGLAKLGEVAEAMPKADFSGLEVEVVDARPATVAYVATTSSTDSEAIGAAISKAYGQVGRFLAKHRLKETAPPLTINHRWDAEGYGFDAAIPIDRAPDQPVPADSPVQVKQTYAGRALKVVHRGAYREMPVTYEKLAAYVAAHGYETAGPPWDEYVTDPGSTPEAELVTHVYMPVR